MDKFVISVLELNTYVGDNLYNDPFLHGLWIKGEISDVNINGDNAYFVLSDLNSSVNCVFFNCSECDLDLLELEGDEVLLGGKITLFKRNGSFRIIVDSIERCGAGLLYEDFKLLKEKLEKEGIFSNEHKQSIPPFPQKIGVVTSKDGAAIHDLTHIIYRRNPFVKITLYPVKVQGENAPVEIVRGIEFLNNKVRPDVLIVGRGGGSAEDLSAFNSERVVRAVYDSKVPIISAVGHESDYTLTDLAADLRASTPSAAAELAVPLAEDILNKLFILKRTLNSAIINKINLTRKRVYDFNNTLNIYNPNKYVSRLYERVYSSKSKLNRLIIQKYNDLNIKYTSINEKISSLYPKTAYPEKFIKVFKNNEEITSASKLNAGDLIEIIFRDGTVNAVVESQAENNR